METNMFCVELKHMVGVKSTTAVRSKGYPVKTAPRLTYIMINDEVSVQAEWVIIQVGLYLQCRVLSLCRDQDHPVEEKPHRPRRWSKSFLEIE